MDFARPAQLLGPSLDGELLLHLARSDADFTGRQLAVALERSSHTGVLKALNRLVRQGIVLSSRAGRAKLYRLNRDHVAAPWIEGLAGLRQQLFDRIRNQVESWTIRPVAAAVFGSVARGDAGPSSDLDLFLVRPKNADLEAWDQQVSALTSAVSRWSGNDARVLEFGEEELPGSTETVIGEIVDDGIEIGGSLRQVRRLVQA